MGQQLQMGLELWQLKESFYKNMKGENHRIVQECGREVEQAKKKPKLGRSFEE